MPVLEALRRGVPVAAPTSPCCARSAASCRASFDPDDPAGAAAAIAAALDDPGDVARRGPALGRRASRGRPPRQGTLGGLRAGAAR